MKVSEIFLSIEGEGKRAGLPCTFIRLFGCNLRCSYCDSMYAVDGDDYTEMTIDEIVNEVLKLGCTNITVTGGEPLYHTETNDLLKALLAKNMWVNVETNGSIQPTVRGTHIFYTVDYKTNSSKMTSLMKPEIFKGLFQNDVIKFVVGSAEDLNQAKEFMKDINVPGSIYVSPVFGKIQPLDIVAYLEENGLWNWHLQLQLHKILWDPEKRGV